ncbi:hypothetical protein Droror1_Dr00008063 [Drosera rotundifolia]
MPSRQSIVCEVAPKGKATLLKRGGDSEKGRLRNKSRKSEARTRMKKVIMFHIPYAKFLLLFIYGRGWWKWECGEELSWLLRFWASMLDSAYEMVLIDRHEPFEASTISLELLEV